MIREVNPIQFWNALFPIYVTLFGMVIESNPEHCWNASFPIDVTLVGIVTEVNLIQLLNTLLPIDVTLFGMITFWIDANCCWKTFALLIVITPLEIVISVMLLDW